MANLYQIWDKEVQGLDSVGAKPEQIEARRQAIAAHFEQKARQAGMSSKDIYATLDNFDTYSRQKTSRFDDGLTPDEREAARDDGSTILGLSKGGLKEGLKAVKDLGLGVASSVPRMVGDLAQTWSDVGDNDPTELSAQLAKASYDAAEDIKSNYSEGTKQRKKDFWSPTGLAMGLGENLGQIAVGAGVTGAAMKGASLLTKGNKAVQLGAGVATGGGLAYGQGYGQGKESALDEINKTSNNDLYANVVTQFDEWKNKGGKSGDKPYLVELYQEANGDLNAMKDLMAEDAGNKAGLLTAATAPIAMGASSFMARNVARDVAASGANRAANSILRQTGARDTGELARRIAAGEGVGSIARQGLKIAGKQSGLQAGEEFIQEGGEGLFAADAGSEARGDKGVLSADDWKNAGMQGLQGAAIGAVMGGGGSLLTMRDTQNTWIAQAKSKAELPKQYQDAFNAFEDAKQAEAQAQAAYEANPTPESEEALAQATDARLKANNQFSQYDAAFKQTFTEQEQQDLLANSLSGIAARAKLAQEAEAQRQAELAEQQKAQRETLVKGLSAFVGNEAVLLNEIDQLGLDEAQSEQLLKEVYQFKQPSSKQAKSNKTPLEKAVDAHFDAKGNRDHKVMSQDVADKYKLPLKEVLRGVLERTRSQEKAKQDAERQAKMQSYEKNKQAEEKLTEQQRLENTLADFAAENDTESMLSMLEGYDKTEADKLFNNAFKTVETRAKEADKAAKAKEAETAKQTQAKQKQSAFNADMSALYESNPNATYNDWKAVGKKYGITSAIDLANAWASARANKTKQKDEQKPKNTETLALPAPSTVMVTDAQGNTTQTTENNVPKKQRNADVSVPSGLNIDVSNAANTQRDRGVGSYSGSASNLIVRQDGKPFPTEQVAQQALTNKTTKKTKTKNNEPVISKETHTVVPVDGGFAIAPVEQVEPVVQQEAKVEVAPQQTDDITGQYTHSQFPDATATVTKTDKGYDINWGDEVQSFTGKNAAEKTQAALKKEGFSKKNPDNDNGGVPVEPVAPKPVSPVDNAQTTPKVTQNTTGEQIAEAFDKTAKAITEASHAKVVERVKNGEEIVYKKPDAIARVQQDDRYEVELNAKGHAVVKNVKDAEGNWVKKPDDVFSQAAAILPVEEKGRVASIYRGTPEEQSKFSSVERVLKTNPATGRAVPLQKVDLSNKRTSHLFDLALDVFGGKPDKNSGIKDSSDIIAINPDKDSLIAYDKDGRLKFFMLSTDGKTWKYMGDVASKPDVSNPSIQAAQRVENQPEIKGEAVHVEDGKIEEVTGEIIRESIAKVDDKPINGLTMSLKQGKQWLLNEANTALANAKDEEKAAEAKRVLAVAKAKEELAVAEKALEEKKARNALLVNQNSKADADEELKLRNDLYDKKMAVIHAGNKVEPERDYVTFKVPNDGSFKVLKTVSALESFIKKVKANRGFDKQSPKKLFPAVPQNSVDTTIAEFLGDGEVENAYEFAKLQDRPIRFGVGNSQGRENTNAYALTEPVDLGGGFKGFVGLSLDTTKKQWIFIEENTRLSIGLFDDTKDKAIKNAKDKLAGLSESDKAKMLVKAKETKIKKTDAELEQQWLSQIGYNPNQNEDEAKAELKAKNEQKQNNAIADDILGEKDAGKAKTEQSDNQKLKSILDDLLSLRDAKKETSIFIADDGKKYNKVQKSVSGRLSKKQYEEIRGIVGLQNSITIENTETKNSGINLTAQTTSEYGSFYAFSTEYILADNVNDSKTKASIIKVKFPLEETVNAWQHSVRNPSEVAKSFKRTFEDFIEEAYNSALLQAETDLQKKVLEQASLKLQQDYIKKFNELNAARSGVTSSFIAGRNNFNGKQAESRGNAFDKVSESFDKWTTSKEDSLKLAVIAARSPEQLAKIKAEKEAKEQKLQDKNDEFLRKVLDFKKGDDFPVGKNQYKVVRVNRNKDGMPISLTLEGKGLIKGIDDKISLFGRGMAYPTINDLREAVARVQEKDESELIPKKSDNEDLAPVEKAQPQVEANKLIDEDRLKAGEISVNEFISANGLNPDDYDGVGFDEPTQKTQYQTLINEMLGVAEEHIALAEKKIASTPQERKAKANTLNIWRNAIYAIGVIKRNFENPFSTRLAIRTDIPNLLKQRFEKKFENLSDAEKYYQAELQSDLISAHRANKAIEWVSKKSDNEDLAPVEKAQQATKEPQPVAAEQEPAKTEEKPAEKPTSKTPLLDKNNNFMDLVRDGKATAEQFKQSFDDLFANKDAVIAELNTLTKDQLFKEGSYNIQYRYKNDKKSVIAEAVYREMIARYSLGRGISYGMGKNSYENAVKKMVDDTDQSRLDDFAKEYKQMIDDRAKEITEKAEALKNPQTLEDYRNLVRSKMADGSTRQEAFLSLTPEQRIKYDELEAESTKETREAKKRALQSTVNTASQTTTGTIIETKHTRDGYDLFVVQLSDRLSTDDYKQVLSEAKRLGGWYSSFRGNGAIAGFQFKDKGSAEAFLALAGGDTTAAKEQIDAKIDAFEDNRSQTAVERLQTMADKLEEKANEELNRDRLANTARRARFAASAEFAARSQIALAKTMRNIAEAISSGKAKFLDNIRMKTDVEALQNYIASAKDNEIRAKYKTYAEQEKRKGQPATVETADFATYPSYTLYRSDLAMLGRKLLEIEGLKKFGQQIMAVADDVSDAYLEFAKKNLHQVSRFSKGDSSLATFSSKDIAERSIRKSGLTGKAIVLQVKRGENIIILSPSEAINLKVWEGDADKRITLKREFGNDLVNAVGRRAGKNNNLLPYQFQLNYDKFKSLSRMGIETPSEFRSALREFIALQEEATNNKVREMELAMVGRKNDGLDFFPTPQVITQQMIEAAEITPDMAVLEPSAGMGHIADMIRATGAEPDVIEMSGERRELLKEKGYHLSETRDFMDMQPRKFFTYGDVFRAPDGKEGVMRGSSGQRVMLVDSDGNGIGYYNRDELEGVRHQGVDSGYDRIIMNPPFSNRQDAEHVRHAYDLLKPNGRIVAIMGEGVFFGSDKKAVEFREWLDSVGGTSEKLPDNSFMDKSLPVNTGVNARMVVIDKQESNNQDTDNKPKFSRSNRVSDIDNLYLDAIKRGDIEEAQRLVIEAAEKAGVPIINDESATAYKVRRSATPIRTQKAYKLFRVKKSQKGEVFALFVGNKDPLPQGVWLDAIPGEAALNPKTGEPTKVKSSLGALAYRPGWHAGDIPLATHIGAMDKEGNIFARKDDEVWAEVEMIADIDYQPEANENGIRNGKFSPAYADIKRMPVDGLYRYKTNANMTGNWIISSSMKINKILTEDEVNSILIANNAKTMPWAKEVKTKDKTEKTDSRSQKVWEKTNLDLAKWGLTDNPAKNQQKLLDPITYDDNGNIIPLSERFNIESDDPRYSSQSSTIGDRTITQVRDKLISRFGKRIVELLESKGILKIHQSMSDKDIPAEALRSIKAYHGSPAMFDKFMREFVNSGEGAQAFGWGHYFAGRKALAEWYRTVLSNDFNRTSFVFRKDGERVRLTDLHTPKSEWEKVNEDELVELFKKYLLGKQSARGETWQADTDPRYDALAEIAKDLSQYNKDTIGYTELKAVQQVMQKYKSKQFSAQRVSTAHNKTGQLYEVDIAAKEESFLDWFTKFDDLSPAEQKSLAKVFKEFDAYGDLDATDKTIGQLYQKVTRYSQDGTPKRLSLALQDLGYSGIKFLDQESRKNPYEKQYFNYVVFDENIISIKDTYYSAQQGVTEGFYLNGTVHLIADNLTDETIIPTTVHELSGHKGFQEMMSPKAYELIMTQFNRLVEAKNPIALAAKQRAEEAESLTDEDKQGKTPQQILDIEKVALARQKDEYLPYLITEQAKNEQATPQQRNAVQRLIDHIVRAVKGWVVRHLSKYDTTYKMSRRVAESLTPADILYMAERMIRDIAKRGGDNNNSPKFSKTEQSQFNQLLAKADKMIAEQGKLLAPNGKPSKLNRYQWAQVRTDNFRNWFGDWENDPANASKVVDDNGEPMVVYHGTRTDFNKFDKKFFGANLSAEAQNGFFFTTSPIEASGYVGGTISGGRVMPVFLSLKRPISLTYKQHGVDNIIDSDAAIAQFLKKSHTVISRIKRVNGLILKNIGEKDKSLHIAFDPIQIKSAIGNNGEFNPTNPDIRFSSTEQKSRSSSLDNFIAKADKMIAEHGKLLAPNGKPSKLNRYQWAQVRTDNFKAWFGDWENDPENSSKVVDENGEPKVVYHGTDSDFNIFEPTKPNFYQETEGWYFFTDKRESAHMFGRKVMPVFLNISNPTIETQGTFKTWNLYDDEGNYGFIAPNTDTGNGGIANQYVVENPTQIKSATDNNGEFSPTNPDIRFSRAEDKAKAAKDYVLDSVRIKKEVAANLNAKKELGWWHKTLGTQQNTAIQYKDFGRVYKTLQRLLQHQSSDVTDALEVAPTLLEKLDSLSDLKEQGKSIGRNIAQYARKVRTGEMTDREAVAKVIFGETLAKKPLSQAELEQKLNSQQLSMYEEARAAINVSLKNTAKSEIIRSLLQNDVINFDTVEKLLNQQTGFDEFVDEMLENVGERISNAQAELSQAETDVEKQAIKDELKRLADMYNSISDVNTKVYKLIDEAYAPLMRFGDYALTMRDKTTGKVLSFMMFESKAERNRMVNYLGTEYGDTVTLETDTMSTEDFKMFKGVTPETVALFAKELGLDKNEAYQGYLKLAIPATSALTRRIQRKGTAGYNEDIQRVLASFVMSNARYSAKNIYLAKADREISEIESGASVRDQAKKMRDNTIDPVDTFAWLRDLLFVWNLGGSVMFAFLNMTQPFMQTIPMLSQYVNTGFATKHVLRGIGVAGKAMATGNAPKGYEAEYKRAVHEGIVDPQNTFMLTGLERGGTGTTSKVWTGTKHILGLFAQMSESLNRKAVFIASLEVANAKGGAWLKQKGYASAYDFAVDVISQTQGVYNKANRSNWAHSQLGAPLLVFKQFSINYVEQMIRMWKNQNEGEKGKKAVLLMLFMLFSLAGGMGLPFIKDIFDGSETIAAFMGNPVNIEREMRLMGKQYLGETTTGALMDGWLNKLVIGEVLGADVQSRTGMGDLIPATNFFNKTIYGTDQQVREGMSIFGAAGGLGDKVGDSLNFMANDEFGDAFVTIMPKFATSMYRGVEMMTTGETTDSKGRKLFDTTFGEGLVKFFDSQPVRMAELSRARGLEYDDIAIQSSKIDYYKKKWIKAAQKEDMEAIEQIEQDIEDWNENNEKYPVIFDRQRAYQSANKNEMTWGEREERTRKGMDWLNEERPDFVRD